MNRSSQAKAKIIALGCMHATSGSSNPSILSLPCAGRLDLSTLVHCFAEGADGVLVLSCVPQECRHRKCEEEPCTASGAAVVSEARQVLAGLGLMPKRLAHRAVSRQDDVDTLIADYEQEIGHLGSWRGAVSREQTEVAAPKSDVGDRFALAYSRVQALLDRKGPTPKTTESGDLLWLGCSAGRAVATDEEGASAEVSRALWRENGQTDASTSSRCCGYPLVEAGDVAGFKKLMQANADLIARSGAKRLVAACPHCVTTFLEDAPAAKVALSIPVVTLWSWVDEVSELGNVGVKVALVAPSQKRGATTASDAIRLFAGSSTVTLLDEPLTSSGAPLQGAELRAALLAMGEEAMERGAGAIVVTCPHRASRWRMALGEESGWQTGAMPPIFDVAQALKSLAGRGISKEEDAG